MRIARIVLHALVPPVIVCSFAVGQELSGKERERRDKIETILRIQDSRSPVNEALLRALGDPDPPVRERAAIACASLQDTTLIDLLTRLLDDPALSSVAAFAIGQTGMALSPAGRQRVEYDLLWNRLRTTVAVEPLLAGLGKFCTAAGLEELLNKLDAAPDPAAKRGIISALSSSAIRGITTDRGVRFLLQQTVPPEMTPWLAVYAMHRIGPHPEILQQFDRLLPLRLHTDPYVRTYYAALLGRLSAQRDVHALLAQMAEQDADLRVRINALRALAAIRNFDPAIFRRALHASDQHLQIVAVQGIAGARWLAEVQSPEVQQLLAELENVARNTGGGFHWQVQSEAILALAKIQGMIFHLPSRPEQRAYELRAIAVVRPPTAMMVFEQEARTGNPQVAVAALEGTLVLVHAERADTSLRTRARALAAAALSRKDVAITTTVASVLVDSLILTDRSVPLLLEALGRQTLSDDLEAILAILEALGKTGDSRAVPALIERLGSPEPSVAHASVRALNKITGKDFSHQVPERGSPLYSDYDFGRLWALPDTVRMTIETARGVIPIELYPRDAPFTVLNFTRLVTERKYFNGLTFHRVVPNFVVQGGDPRGDGWGGPGYTIRSEFPPKPFDVGSIGMASAGKDTEGSQFFITHAPQPHLDGRYTVFGRVASGQHVVDQLQVGDTIVAIRPGW